MKEGRSLSHTRWDCKYHAGFIVKRRKKPIFGALKRHLGEIFHELVGYKESKIVVRSPDGRPCSYVYQHSAEVGGFERGGLHQG
jgi:hypothetical protein